jgi:CheY-like chemotaxis protein
VTNVCEIEVSEATRELAASEMPSRGTILIIDDDPAVCYLVRTLLCKVGFSVLEAENGAVGTQIAAEQQPDLVITDWEMPVQGGRETIERLRSDARTSTVPIVVLTMRSESVCIVQALEAGAQDFITKPLQREEFVARLEQQLRWRRLLASDVVPGTALADPAPDRRAPARRPVQEAMDRGDPHAALDLAVAGAEQAERDKKYLEAAGLYRGGAAAAAQMGNPDLGNKLLRLAGKMYMLLAESARSDGTLIEDAYTLAARMFMAAGNLTLARHAIDQTK